MRKVGVSLTDFLGEADQDQFADGGQADKLPTVVLCKNVNRAERLSTRGQDRI